VTYRSCVLSRLRFAVSPGWLLWHLVSLALIVTMVLLGRWQLDVSNSKHFSLQNFGYALQWWAFSVFVAVMWVRVLRDHLLKAAEGSPAGIENAEAMRAVAQPVAYRRYLMPSAADAQPAERDSERARYNDYLARLAEGDR
jgi:DNA-binding transcriptional regulator of glucitol operon